MCRRKDAWVIDQVSGQDGWILAKFFSCVFMDRDGVEVHKLAKKERGQYPPSFDRTKLVNKGFTYHMAFGEILLAERGG